MPITRKCEGRITKPIWPQLSESFSLTLSSVLHNKPLGQHEATRVMSPLVWMYYRRVTTYSCPRENDYGENNAIYVRSIHFNTYFEACIKLLIKYIHLQINLIE